MKSLLACSTSKAYTSRSRKLRRGCEPPRNSRSICGVSQMAEIYCPEFRLRSAFLAVDFDNAAIKAAAFFFVFAQAFFHRGSDLKFLAVFGNRCRNRPTGIARHVLFVNHGRGKTLIMSAKRAPGRPRPGVRKETASRMLVLPLPFSPVMIIGRNPGFVLRKA